jgi:hypothetical protein
MEAGMERTGLDRDAIAAQPLRSQAAGRNPGQRPFLASKRALLDALAVRRGEHLPHQRLAGFMLRRGRIATPACLCDRDCMAAMPFFQLISLVYLGTCHAIAIVNELLRCNMMS